MKKISRNIPHDQTEKDTGQRNSDSPEKYAGIEKVFKKSGIVAQLKSRNDCSGGGPQPETIYYDKESRDNQQQKNGAQGWG